MRRSSRPAGPGLELKKSIHTELSTRIRLGSSAWPSGHLARCRIHSNEECLCDSRSGRVTQGLWTISRLVFSRVSLRASRISFSSMSMLVRLMGNIIHQFVDCLCKQVFCVDYNNLTRRIQGLRVAVDLG